MTANRIDDHKLIFHPERVAGWLATGDCFPVYVEIGLTNRCNHQCAFCALDWLDHKQAAVFIDREVLLRNLADMAAHGVRSLMFAGEGESLLHRDAAEFIRAAHGHGIKVALTTNGVPFGPRLAAQALPHLSWVRFSVSAGTPETYARIHQTQADDFARVLSNIASAARLKKEGRLDVDIGVQMLLIQDNAHEATLLAEQVKKAGADNLQIKPYSHHPNSRNEFVVDYSRYDALEAELAAFADPSFTVFFRRNTIQRIRAGFEYDTCHGLPFFALVTATGDVIPCNLFYGDADATYGNLNDRLVSEIWRGEKRRAVLETLRHKGIASCREACRLDPINRYLHRVKHPESRDVFI